MALHPVGEADLPALAAFINAAYRGETARQGWTHEADYLDGQRTDPAMLSADLAAHPGAALLAWREDGELLACVWLQPAQDALWKLGLLTVRPDRQGRGVGRRVLEAAEAYAAQHGAGRLAMAVIGLRGPLIAWYRRHGYQPTGAVEPFPYGDSRFGLPLRDDLEFTVLEKGLDAPP
jgi:GNAT superfamily N-acetyltransferase